MVEFPHEMDFRLKQAVNKNVIDKVYSKQNSLKTQKCLNLSTNPALSRNCIHTGIHIDTDT